MDGLLCGEIDIPFMRTRIPGCDFFFMTADIHSQILTLVPLVATKPFSYIRGGSSIFLINIPTQYFVFEDHLHGAVKVLVAVKLYGAR